MCTISSNEQLSLQLAKMPGDSRRTTAKNKIGHNFKKLSEPYHTTTNNTTNNNNHITMLSGNITSSGYTHYQPQQQQRVATNLVFSEPTLFLMISPRAFEDRAAVVTGFAKKGGPAERKGVRVGWVLAAVERIDTLQKTFAQTLALYRQAARPVELRCVKGFLCGCCLGGHALLYCCWVAVSTYA